MSDGWLRSTGVLLVIALAAGACSSGSDDSSGDGDPGASTSAAPAPEQVRVVSQNILHGIACPADSNLCDLPARLALFVEQVAEAGCPEVLALQEANQGIVDELSRGLAAACEAAYDAVWDDDPGVDREVVFTSLPVVASERVRLAGPLRTAYYTRLAAPLGPLDLVVTHLASGSDDRPCDAQTCPPPCAAADTVNTCQGRQVVALLASRVDEHSVGVLLGDLNAQPPEPTIGVLRSAGLVDTHLAAGNAECDVDTGDQCTSGRVDDSLADLSDPASRQYERIDYVWLDTERDCDVIDPTGLFNGEPAAAAGGLAFPSDHTGVQATIECMTTGADRDAADDEPASSATSSTTTAGGAVDEATRAAIVATYETFFNGDVDDPEGKLAVLEEPDVARDFFLQQYEAVRGLASQTRVRVESVTLRDPQTADVVFSILLGSTVVLDHLPGEARLRDGRWLLPLRTYCSVATLGVETIPDFCR